MEGMDRMEKKKKRSGLTVFLIVLAVLLLIPVGTYCYLRFGGFGTARLRAGFDPHAPYTGEAVHANNGESTVFLTDRDLYWLVDNYGMEQINEALPDMIELTGLWLAPKAGGIDVYADGELWNWIPAPLKASLSGAYRKGELALVLEEIRLGKAISIPLEKLTALGVEKEFTVSLEDAGLTSRITSLDMEAEGVRVTERLLPLLLPKAFDGAQSAHTALALSVYEGDAAWADNSLAALSADPYAKRPSAQELCAMAAEGRGARETLLALLALCGEKGASILSEMDDFEAHFVLPLDEKTAADRRGEYMSRLSAGQEQYETLVNRLAERYRNMELKLTVGGLVDADSEKALSLSALYPAAGLDDAESKVVFLTSDDALQAVDMPSMPLLSDVPQERGATDGGVLIKPYFPAVLTRMPNGMPALLYKQADGYFIVNLLPGEGEGALYQELMGQNKPVFLWSDELPRPHVRTKCAAPAGGLSPFQILLAEPGE